MNQASEDRIPPHSIELEMNVLGAMLLSRQAISLAQGWVSDQSFYRGKHRQIFKAIVDMYDRGSRIDLPLVAEALDKDGNLEECGGTPYLADLAACVGTSVNVEYHAELVADKHRRRKVIALTAQVQTRIFDTSEEADVVMERFQRDLDGANRIGQRDDVKVIGSMTENALEWMNSESTGKGLDTIPTGFDNLDRILYGLGRGELILVGGRPGMGKSAFCMNIATHVALVERIPTLVFSLEMTAESLVRRSIRAQARQSTRGGVPEGGWEKLVRAADDLSNSPLFIDETAGVTMPVIRACAQRMCQKENVGLVIIDYLQLIKSAGRVESQNVRITEISNALKTMAKDLKIPVIAAAQLNRGPTNENRKPKMTDLRESGSLEQDADKIVFVHRPEEYYERGSAAREEKKGQAQLIVDKHRDGEVGTVNCYWHGEYTRFDDGTTQTEWEGASDDQVELPYNEKAEK